MRCQGGKADPQGDAGKYEAKKAQGGKADPRTTYDLSRRCERAPRRPADTPAKIGLRMQEYATELPLNSWCCETERADPHPLPEWICVLGVTATSARSSI